VALRKSFNNPFRGSFTGIFGKVSSLFGSGKKKRSRDESFSYKRPKTDEEYNAEKIEKQKKTDRILEKISKGGYDSLSKEEKEFLFRSSDNSKGDHDSR
jgi:hypothetical protein